MTARRPRRARLGPDPDRAAMLAAGLAERPKSESPVVALRAVFGHLAESFAERQPMWQARMELVRANPQLGPQMHAGFTEFERALTETVAARIGCDPAVDLYRGVVAVAAVGAMRVAVSHWRAAGESASLPDLVVGAFDVLAASLAAPPPATDGASR